MARTRNFRHSQGTVQVEQLPEHLLPPPARIISGNDPEVSMQEID
jgi:hypothetical protein